MRSIQSELKQAIIEDAETLYHHHKGNLEKKSKSLLTALVGVKVLTSTQSDEINHLLINIDSFLDAHRTKPQTELKSLVQLRDLLQGEQENKNH